MAMRGDRPGERRLRDQIRFLLDTARALSREPDLDALFEHLYLLIAEQFATWSCFIALDAGNRLELDVTFHMQDGRRCDGVRVPIDGTIAGEVFRSGQPLLVRTNEEFARLRTVVYPPPSDDTRDSASAIYAPLRIGERPLGVLSVQSLQERAYDEQDLELLVAVAEQTAIAVENAHRLREIDQQRRELELLLEIGSGLATDEFSGRQMCRRILAKLSSIIEIEVFYVALLSDDGLTLYPEYCIEAGRELEIEALPLKDSLAEHVLETGEPVLSANVPGDTRTKRYERFGNRSLHMHSVLMLPLKIGERTLGVISVQSSRIGAYDEASLRLLRSISDQIAIAINNLMLYRQTEARADHDSLTGLYNRRYAMSRLSDELERSTRRGTRICVMMLDLDNFKTINDNYGHSIGDLALQAIADSLRRACRGSDIVCRYGGDEFLVIFPDLIEAETAPMVTRVRDELMRDELTVPGGTIAMEASLGVAVSRAGMSAEELIGNADRALYADKARSREKRA
jgi:two-component system cell cycle response regulator